MPPGQDASVEIRTAPHAAATITVDYRSGPSHASGLGPRTSDAQGYVTWTWEVGTRTTPGYWPVVIVAGGHIIHLELHVDVRRRKSVPPAEAEGG